MSVLRSKAILKRAFFLMVGATVCAASPPSPNFYARVDYPQGFNEQTLEGDTNGDGIPDLISAAGGISVKFGNGDGTFRSGPISDVFDGYPGVNTALQAVADVNHDGKLDAIFTGYYNFQCCENNYVQMFLALGNGDGTFQRGTFY